MSDARKVAIAATPLAVMIALAAALRVGASDRAVAAMIYGSPLASDAHALAWQVATLADDHGIREAVAVPDLVVTATHAGARAEWHGASNAEGIAEAHLALDGLHDGDEITLDVRGAGRTLASGRAAWGPSWTLAPHAAPARASRRDGAILLDVVPVGEHLAVGAAGSLAVRATDRVTGAAVGGVAIEVEPEPGLDVATSRVVTCANGWAEIVATPTYLLVGASLHAQKNGHDGLWYGGIPVAGGASRAVLPPRIAPDQARAIPIETAATRGALYAEIDDAHGRVFAQVLAAPHATIDAPPLARGLYWLVTSTEPRGAEALTGGTLARPFLVSDAAGGGACATTAALAEASVAGFPRWVALDGFAGRREGDRARRRLGVTIGLAALVIGAALEALLVLGSARRAGEELPRALVRRTPAGSIAVGVLAALLGFALLAALLVYRG